MHSPTQGLALRPIGPLFHAGESDMYPRCTLPTYKRNQDSDMLLLLHMTCETVAPPLLHEDDSQNFRVLDERGTGVMGAGIC